MEEKFYEREQSKLLSQISKHLEPFNRIVFHGGTVLNLFYPENFNRYSVDLDGIFNFQEENASHINIQKLIHKELKEIQNLLLTPHIKESNKIRTIEFYPIANKLIISKGNPLNENKPIKVILSVHPTYIGTILEPVKRRLNKKARKEFGIDSYINSVSDIELIGGKIGALLSRNKIKDSFDTYKLLEKGLDLDKYIEGIIYSLLSSPQSIAYFLNSNKINIPKKNVENYNLFKNLDFSSDLHLKTKTSVRSQFFDILTEKDILYLLSYAFGVLDKTDYKYRNMYSIKNMNKKNRRLIKTVDYQNNIRNMYESFPLKTPDINEFYDHQKQKNTLGI